MNKKQRLLLSLAGNGQGGLPVICPGGMMSMVCREISETNRFNWSEAHARPEIMARAAMDMAENTGFENLGVPFCVTVEAEAIGGIVDFGDATIEPRIVNYVLTSSSDLGKLKINQHNRKSRIPVVLEAISILKEQKEDIPIIGNLTGPVSLATSLMDPNLFLRYLIKDKSLVKEIMDYSTEVIASFGEAQAKAGADVISIGDPTASGEILGPEFFNEFVAPSLNEIIKRIKRQKARTILHICGNIESILGLLRSTDADALSFDASISIKTVRSKVGNWALMGNISTFLLAGGPPESIIKTTQRVVEDGIDIVSPACGLGTGTPLGNVKAMTNTVYAIRRGFKREKE
jgi:MtaA/CmuA family methyltransferase